MREKKEDKESKNSLLLWNRWDFKGFTL